MIDEKPTGSKDPYALRRAALGVIRLIVENKLRLPLGQVFAAAQSDYGGLQAAPVAESLLEFFGEQPADFVARRHTELRERQLANAEIFEQIAREVAGRRFRAPDLSERQIRRLIYG